MSKGKEQISLLASIMSAKGITEVVVSPGSRNAPAIILFARQKELNLISIADERSAGFFALGIAISKSRPVALLCTSGTAALNYAPAIAEAFYQKVPLLVITADRPSEWIDQGDGQTIRQENVYSNYVRKSFNLPAIFDTPDAVWMAERTINEAIDRCLFPVAGPVHLNMPVAEPLYRIDVHTILPKARIMEMAIVEKKISDILLKRLSELWNRSESKLILVGQINSDIGAGFLHYGLTSDPSVCILTETTSNLHHPSAIGCIDRVIDGMDEEMIHTMKPDILVTFEGAVVSKKVKALLRRMKPATHWHICEDPGDFYTDTYQSLTLTIPVPALTFTGQLADSAIPVNSDYRLQWLNLSQNRRIRHEAYILNLSFCDMLVYDILFRSIPAGGEIHLANSTPVRYAQLFDHQGSHRFFSNRGTSGIDGCVSTAAGFAYASDKPVTVITGDIGFFYDSNALWNNNLNKDFRIIIINNGGGNIFRILDGPSEYEQLETYIETVHHLTAENLAMNFGLRYFKAGDKHSLENHLAGFFDFSHATPAILEIITPNIISADALKDYFKFLNS
ncbi:MAG: 2-succinyl-5-enolpyruvyl-6-hydroxy-3-cyclohexene-1-carboxylic-acid synthase [Bacteroidota bacterium]